MSTALNAFANQVGRARPFVSNSGVNPHESLWQTVDAALVINLDHRTDRWEIAQQHLQQIIPPQKLQRFPAVLGKQVDGYGEGRWFKHSKRPETWAWRAGCTLSHRNVMREAIEKGWNWVLVLEDDAEFDQPLAGTVAERLVEFLSVQGDRYGVVYLGFTSPRGPVRKIWPIGDDQHVYQLSGASTTHAYLINRATMEMLLPLFPESDDQVWEWLAKNVAIDQWYSLNLWRMTKVAAVSSQLAAQAVSHSDITLRESDYGDGVDRDLLHQLQRTEPWKLQETVHRLSWNWTMLRQKMKTQLRYIRGL